MSIFLPRCLPKLFFSILFSLLLIGCTSSSKTYDAQVCVNSEKPCLRGTLVVQLETSRGNIEIAVIGDSAPLTGGNFVDLVSRGIYDGTIFHRVVRDPVPFVIQGGDPASVDNLLPPNLLGTGGFVDPITGRKRLIPLEMKLKGEQLPRYNNIIQRSDDLSNLELTHQRGSVAMARSQSPDSASAQFYIALKPLPELDGRYSIFGKVINGLDVIDLIRQGDIINRGTSFFTRFN